jgi:hypothetical protein
MCFHIVNILAFCIMDGSESFLSLFFFLIEYSLLSTTHPAFSRTIVVSVFNPNVLALVDFLP